MPEIGLYELIGHYQLVELHIQLEVQRFCHKLFQHQTQRNIGLL
jgi:hypothetical protein